MVDCPIDPNSVKINIYCSKLKLLQKFHPMKYIIDGDYLSDDLYIYIINLLSQCISEVIHLFIT